MYREREREQVRLLPAARHGADVRLDGALLHLLGYVYIYIYIYTIIVIISSMFVFCVFNITIKM